MTFWDPIQEKAESSTSSDVLNPASHHGNRKTAFLNAKFKGEDKVGISNHSKTRKCTTPSATPSPVVPKPNLCHPEVQSLPVTSPHTTAQVWDIIALKQAFSNSFDTIGNMTRTYTIRTDPSFPPVQHARLKATTKYKDQIEKALDEMVLKGVIAPVSRPTPWVSSLTYPHKPDGSLSICLDPKDLNKAIV